MTKHPSAPALRDLYTRPVDPQSAYANGWHHLARACWAATRAADTRANPSGMAREIYRDEYSTVPVLLLERGAITAATTDVPAWAGTLAETATGDFLAGLTPTSAASTLIAAGSRITLSGQNGAEVAFPIRAGGPVTASWVQEGYPIPISADVLSVISLGPARKLATIFVMTRELVRRSQAETIFRTLLRENAAKSLDAAYFSADAGTDAVHQGLLYGLSSLTPNVGTDVDAMIYDVGALATAVGTGGSGQTVFVSGPGRAAQMNMWSSYLQITVLPSLAVPETRVIGIDPASIIHGTSGEPEIIASLDTTLHMNTVPTAIGVAGSPNVVAAPTSSMFQEAKIALRLIVDIAFAARRTGAVAFLDNPAW